MSLDVQAEENLKMLVILIIAYVFNQYLFDNVYYSNVYTLCNLCPVIILLKFQDFIYTYLLILTTSTMNCV